MFIIILLGIKQLNKLWKKTFLNIHHLSCFVGHPVCKLFDHITHNSRGVREHFCRGGGHILRAIFFVCPPWQPFLKKILIPFLTIRSFTHSTLTVHQNNALERIQRVCVKIILGKDYVGDTSAFESCELETLESRKDKLSLSFANKCIKSSKHQHLFPAAVHPHEHQLRHQEQYHVNHARTEK